jgi:hypothetical protein
MKNVLTKKNIKVLKENIPYKRYFNYNNFFVEDHLDVLQSSGLVQDTFYDFPFLSKFFEIIFDLNSISEISYIVSYGIIHHTDNISNRCVIIPLTKNSHKFGFKYVTWENKEVYTVLERFGVYKFNDYESHSLAPVGIPSKHPIGLISISCENV